MEAPKKVCKFAGKLVKMTEVDVQNAESKTETVLQEMLAVEKKKLR